MVVRDQELVGFQQERWYVNHAYYTLLIVSLLVDNQRLALTTVPVLSGNTFTGQLR